VNHSADVDHDLARRTWRLIALTAVMLVSAFAQSASAQGEISGRVMVSDSSRSPIRGAEVSIVRLGRTALSDSSGRFRLKDVPPGRHLVMLRSGGFRPESSIVTMDFDEVVSWDVVLTRTAGTMLPVRVVEASGEPTPAKLVEFLERQKLGIGHFIDRDQLQKAEGGRRQTGDLIALVPGVAVKRGTNKIWVASSRAPRPKTCTFCKSTGLSTSAAATPGGFNRADFAAGARPACYMDVYLDGAMVFDSQRIENGLFDVNSVPPEHIAGIEVYAGQAQIPIKYARSMDNVCGVLLIWTR